MNQHCSICLENIENSDITTLDCNHTFHSDCITQWKKYTYSKSSIQHNMNDFSWECPLCRSSQNENSGEADTCVRDMFILLKFRRYRENIIQITSTHIILNFLFALLFSQPFSLIPALVSIYGYVGARSLSLNTLTCYMVTCCIWYILAIISCIQAVKHNIYQHTLIQSEYNIIYILHAFILFVTGYIIYLVSQIIYVIHKYNITRDDMISYT